MRIYPTIPSEIVVSKRDADGKIEKPSLVLQILDLRQLKAVKGLFDEDQPTSNTEQYREVTVRQRTNPVLVLCESPPPHSAGRCYSLCQTNTEGEMTTGLKLP